MTDALLSDALRQTLLSAGTRMDVPAGTVLFRAGDTAPGFVVVLSGSVRVDHESETGRRILLYRVEPGGPCVLTTNGLIAGALYDAEGTAEDDSEILMLSPARFDALMEGSADFRRYALASFTNRLRDLMDLIEELMVRRIDLRLAGWLSQRDQIESTHQAIADELGTVREVVSRMLKEFERKGWVALARGRVEIRDATALHAYSRTGV
ncbi:MAG: Crp/Fnr family transcriptional regulator [Rubricella sp.]